MGRGGGGGAGGTETCSLVFERGQVLAEMLGFLPGSWPHRGRLGGWCSPCGHSHGTLGRRLLHKSSAAIFKEKAMHGNVLDGHTLDHCPFSYPCSK